MSLVIKKPKTVAPMEAGTYAAVCVGVIDIGEQLNEKFKNYSNKVILIFEIPSETVEIDGEMKPRWISETYGATLSDKGNLKKTLTAWRGKPLSDKEAEEFDLLTMAGKSCIINIIVEEKDSGTYNKIAAINPLMKGMPEPELKNEILVFDMDNWSDDVFEKLPEWIQNRIKKSTQYQKNHVVPENIEFPTEEKQNEQDTENQILQEAPF